MCTEKIKCVNICIYIYSLHLQVKVEEFCVIDKRTLQGYAVATGTVCDLPEIAARQPTFLENIDTARRKNDHEVNIVNCTCYTEL